MSKSFKEVIEDVCELLEWNVDFEEKDKHVSFYKCSPAGEEFCIELYYDDLEQIPDFVYDEYQYFDIEDHVYMWLEAKKHGDENVPGIVELVHDAESIEKMILELAEKLRDELNNFRKEVN